MQGKPRIATNRTGALEPAVEKHRERGVLTPLARTLRGEPRMRATPLDVFALARAKWLRGERLDIGQIASELGVGRATVFRWVGSREQLYGEVLSAAYVQQRDYVEGKVGGRGVERVAEVVRHNLRGLLESAPLRRFIEQDPEFAIRVLTSKSSPLQARSVELEAKFLDELVKRGEIRPSLDVDTLAYVIVRIGEAFLYGDVISGRKPEIEKAVAAIRILVAAEEPQVIPARKRRHAGSDA